MVKTCSKCEYSKSHVEFYRSDRHKDGRYSVCKKCCQKKARARYADNPERQKKSQEKYFSNNPGARKSITLKHKFGILSEEFDSMLDEQNGLCAICNKPETSKHQNGRVKTLSVDHRHIDGKIRGLLCSRCNHAIGLLMDDPKIVDSASNYLKRFL